LIIITLYSIFSFKKSSINNNFGIKFYGFIIYPNSKIKTCLRKLKGAYERWKFRIRKLRNRNENYKQLYQAE